MTCIGRLLITSCCVFEIGCMQGKILGDLVGNYGIRENRYIYTYILNCWEGKCYSYEYLKMM